MIDVRQTGVDVEAYARKLAAAMTVATAKAVLRAGQAASGELAQAVMDLLTKRPTGGLARSFEVTFVDGEEPRSRAASSLPYAKIQDEGGTIRPKRAKMLAIPLDGVPRGMRPREYGQPLSFRPAKGGGGVLVDPSGKPRFSLRRSVVIRGVGFVRVALARLEEQLPEIADHELRAAVVNVERETD